MQRKCTIKILNQVQCVFIGLQPEHVAILAEQYSFFAPNHFFNPKFKLGTWDGKISYFHLTGKTYIYLLETLVPRVANMGYELALIDTRPELPAAPADIDKDFFSHIIEPDSGKPWEVRQYQLDGVNSVIRNAGGVIIAGTGAGKTSMCAAIARSYEESAGLRSITIVPDKNLTEQTYTEYVFFGLDVGRYYGDIKEYSHQHLVSTWQSLQNNPHLIREFQVVIVDECQGLRGPILTELLIKYGQDIPYRFGVTGTLPKEKTDEMAVKISVGDVQYEVPAHWLIAQNFLSTLDIDILQMDIDLTEQYQEYLEEDRDDKEPVLTYSRFKNSYFPDWPAEKRFLQTDKTKIAWLAQYISTLRVLDKGNVFCLVSGISFGRKLAKEIDGAIFLHGKDDVAVRQAAYDQYSTQNDMVVIATVNIASTGLNIKRIFNLVMVDIGKSFIRTIQTIGRGLRKANDKDYINISDICTDLKYSKKHLTARMKYYTEAKYPHTKTKVKMDKVDG